MHGLVDELRTYLSAIEAEQAELADVQARKGVALRRADAASLVALVARESSLVHSLNGRLGDREELLQRARTQGHPVGCVTDLVNRLDDPVTSRSLARTHATAERLQRETWAHWIIARRSVGQYDEMLDLIAHSGRRAPTYSTSQPTADDSAGGSVLDASA